MFRCHSKVLNLDFIKIFSDSRKTLKIRRRLEKYYIVIFFIYFPKIIIPTSPLMSKLKQLSDSSHGVWAAATTTWYWKYYEYGNLKCCNNNHLRLSHFWFELMHVFATTEYPHLEANNKLPFQKKKTVWHGITIIINSCSEIQIQFPFRFDRWFH